MSLNSTWGYTGHGQCVWADLLSRESPWRFYGWSWFGAIIWKHLLQTRGQQHFITCCLNNSCLSTAFKSRQQLPFKAFLDGFHSLSIRKKHPKTTNIKTTKAQKPTKNMYFEYVYQSVVTFKCRQGASNLQLVPAEFVWNNNPFAWSTTSWLHIH